MVSVGHSLHELQITIPELATFCKSFTDRLNAVSAFGENSRLERRINLRSEGELIIRLEGVALISPALFEGNGTVELRFEDEFVKFTGSWVNGRVSATEVATNYSHYTNGKIFFLKDLHDVISEDLTLLRAGRKAFDLGIRIRYDNFTLTLPLDPRRGIRLTTIVDDFIVDIESDPEISFPLPGTKVSVSALYKEFFCYSSGKAVLLHSYLIVTDESYSISWTSVGEVDGKILEASAEVPDRSALGRLLDPKNREGFMKLLGITPPYVESSV